MFKIIWMQILIIKLKYQLSRCSVMNSKVTHYSPVTPHKVIQVPISAVSTSSHSEQRSQARQSRWYCGKTWESRSVPNLKVKPLYVNRGVSLFICSLYFHNYVFPTFILNLEYHHELYRSTTPHR